MVNQSFMNVKRSAVKARPCLALAQSSRDLRSQMRDMAEVLQSHQVVNFDRLGLADPIDIVPRQIHQHDMLGPIFLGRQQLRTKLLVL